MGKEIKAINFVTMAVNDNRVNPEKWYVNDQRVPCEDSASASPEGECRQGLSLNYYNGSGAGLIFYSPSPINKLFRPTEIHYSAKISGKEIYLLDNQTNDPSGTMPEDNTVPGNPDGKLTQHELFSINGFAYSFCEVPISEDPEDPGAPFFYLPGVFEVKSDVNNQRARYHGLWFLKNGDDWMFIGPDSRYPAGEELEKLLKELKRQYSDVLAKAAEDIKPVTPNAQKKSNL